MVEIVTNGRRRTAWGLSIAAGVVGVLVGGLLLGFVTGGDPSPADSSQAQVKPSRRLAFVDRTRRLAAIKRGEGREHPTTTPIVVDDAEPTAGGTDIRTVEEEEDALERLNEEWLRALGTHWDSARDPGWSQPAEGAFAADFEALSDGRDFEFIGVDCRTDTCVATVDWPNFSAAENDVDQILHARTTESCAVKILIPEPDDRDAAVRAEVLYLCAEGY